MPQAAAAGPAIIIILGVLSAFGPLSMDMYLPGLPALAAWFATSPGNAQLTLSAFVVGFAVCQLVYGPLSDQLGRKWVLVGGVALFAVAGAACAVAPDIESLIVFRFLQAVGGGAGVVLTRAIVRDLYAKEAGARALSLMLLVPSLAALIGPFVGGQILQYADWRVIFWLLTAFGVFTLLLAALRLPETLAPERRQRSGLLRILGEYVSILRHRRTVGYMLCGAFSFSGMMAQMSGTPFIYIELFGVSPQNFGFLFALNIVGIMLGSFVNSRLVMRLGLRRMLIAGTTVALAGGLALAGFALAGWGGLAGIVAPIVLFMAPHNVVNANATAAALERFPHIAGTASALIGAIRFGTGAAVGALVGLAHDGTALPMALVLAGCAIGSAAAFWFLADR